MKKTWWDELIARIRQGESTETDAQTLELLQIVLCALAQSYPGDTYHAVLARLLQMHKRMEEGLV